jgi:hypothetical protein
LAEPERRVASSRWRNLLADGRLQLRYILLVTGVAAVIATGFGLVIYQQSTFASDQIIATLDASDMDWLDETTKATVRAHLGAADLDLAGTMIAFGVGLALVLVLALLLMTHRVVEPLRRLRWCFAELEEHRLGVLGKQGLDTQFRHVFENLQAAHATLRQRAVEDVDAIGAFLDMVGDAQDRSPALRAAVGELRALYQSKRDALG